MSNPLKRRKVARAAAAKKAADLKVAPVVKKVAPAAPKVAPKAPQPEKVVEKKGPFKW